MNCGTVVTVGKQTRVPICGKVFILRTRMVTLPGASSSGVRYLLLVALRGWYQLQFYNYNYYYANLPFLSFIIPGKYSIYLFIDWCPFKKQYSNIGIYN